MQVLCILFLLVASVFSVEESELLELQSFKPSFALQDMDKSSPVFSMSHFFPNIGGENGTSIETAIPIRIPENECWDVRALEFQIVVGRKETAHAKDHSHKPDVFHFDWDASALIEQYGAFMRVYPTCAYDTGQSDSSTLPCSREHTHGMWHTPPTNSDRPAVHSKAERTWGYLYTVSVIIQNEPNKTGILAKDTIWTSLVSTMPRIGQSNDATHYWQYGHWLPVSDSGSPENDLAFVDWSNILGNEWDYWHRGHVLSHSLYEEVAHPLPWYRVIGNLVNYSDCSKDENGNDPASNLPSPQNGYTHKNGNESVQNDPSYSLGVFGTIAAALGSAFAGILIALLVVALVKRRKARQERHRQLDNLRSNMDAYDSDNESDELLPGSAGKRNDGGYASDLPPTSRSDSSESYGHHVSSVRLTSSSLSDS